MDNLWDRCGQMGGPLADLDVDPHASPPRAARDLWMELRTKSGYDTTCSSWHKTDTPDMVWSLRMKVVHVKLGELTLAALVRP